MRVLVAPAGSRGDFQPLLAFALGLRAAGHQVLVAASPNFASELAAFGLPFQALGFDVEAYMRELELFTSSRTRATWELFKVGRREIFQLIAEALPLARGVDVVVGGGAQIFAPTAAEAAGVPYVYVAYSPQSLWSAEHPPFTMPVFGLPRPLNRVLWSLSLAAVRAAFGGPLNRQRRLLGLPPVRDWYDHFFPRRRTILAADPEIAPPAPDSPLAHPPVGAFHLEDQRPLAPELERFLASGPAPVYAGFGSMPDADAAGTTQIFLDAARSAGVRLVLSRGWAGHGAGVPAGDGALVIGPTSHALLFPRVAAIVHHGGAGTTAAATRAGRPQILVPHVFDQFLWGRRVLEARLGPAPISRHRLAAKSLGGALQAALGEARYRDRAAEIAAQVRARNSIAAGIAALQTLAQR